MMDMGIHVFDSVFSFFPFYSGPGSWEMLRYGFYWFIMHEQGATQDFFIFFPFYSGEM